MNINDRKRIAALIEREYDDRVSAATVEPTVDEIAKESDAILVKHRLKDKVAKLIEARKSVEELGRQLSVAVESLRKGGRKKTRGRYDGCECHADYSETLQEIAKANLLDHRKSSKVREKLRAEERRLLAKVEVAESVEDLKKIAVEAGLL